MTEKANEVGARDPDFAQRTAVAMLAATPGDGTDDWPGQDAHNLADCYLDLRTRLATLEVERDELREMYDQLLDAHASPKFREGAVAHEGTEPDAG